MPIFTDVKVGIYYDSITLLKLQKQLTNFPGVQNAAVVMATEVNKMILQQAQLWIASLEKTGAEDLVISLCADNEAIAQKALATAWDTLRQNQASSEDVERPKNITSAIKILPEANLALISVPGKFAASQARQALEQNLHVMLFSDNVSIEEELQLKQFALDKGLLVMGPDCGTAIINGVGLGFANAVRRGHIGIVGASGTGIQEVTCLIHSLGAGISHAIGTGGRDLSRDIGAITMLQGLSALENDPQTQVIVLISKPPHPEVINKVITAANQAKKPIVICFLGANNSEVAKSVRNSILLTNTLDQVAKVAVLALQKVQAGIIPTSQHVGTEASPGTSPDSHEIKPTLAANSFFVESWDSQKWKQVIQSERATRNQNQKYLRGLYSGGTLAYEAIFLLKPKLTHLYSNLSKDSEHRLQDPGKSYQHSIIDLGEDEYTVGRPHPMIDNNFRIQRLLQEGNDPETAVLLFDLVLGYGSQNDPLSVFIPALQQIIHNMKAQNRHIALVTHICGTQEDPQNLIAIAQGFEHIGVHCTLSNAVAAKLAMDLL